MSKTLTEETGQKMLAVLQELVTEIKALKPEPPPAKKAWSMEDYKKMRGELSAGARLLNDMADQRVSGPPPVEMFDESGLPPAGGTRPPAEFHKAMAREARRGKRLIRETSRPA